MKKDRGGEAWLTGPEVAQRFSISSMSLWRWMHDAHLNFPRPVRIRARNYWRQSEIDEWERKLAAGAGKRLWPEYSQ